MGGQTQGGEVGPREPGGPALEQLRHRRRRSAIELTERISRRFVGEVAGSRFIAVVATRWHVRVRERDALVVVDAIFGEELNRLLPIATVARGGSEPESPCRT